MTLRDLSIKSSYETGIDDLVREFYIPALECAVSYDRIAGFFSSTSLAIAARGIAALIYNDGQMRLLASPELSKEDTEIIQTSTKSSAVFFEQKLMNSIDVVSGEFERDHLSALGWMLTNGILEIRLALPLDESGRITTGNEIFHQKVGILKDREGNSISFSGSVNESATGWIRNIEEFKVFKGWVSGQSEYFRADTEKFNSFWNSSRPYVKIVDLPTAVRERLISYSRDFDRESFVTKYYQRSNTHRPRSVEDNLSLFPYQKAAMEKWIGNQYSMLFEMATGTGKTRTALACVNHLMQRHTKIAVIIACPEHTLAVQWKTNEVEPAGFRFDSSIIVDGTNHKWRTQLPTELNKLAVGLYAAVAIYTTHSTASKPDFINIMNTLSPQVSVCFVGDEAHGLGASQMKNALIPRYNYRIGLSATPERWFDDAGTVVLRDYFGNESFEFSIADALTTINPITKKTFLVNYFYKPIFVSLCDDELDRYVQLTNRIRRLANCKKTDDEYQKRFESLLFARADIQKNARNKMEALKRLLQGLGPQCERLLIFVSPEQIPDVMRLLQSLRITAHKFTMDEGTKSDPKFGGISEREYLVKLFKDGTYQALVAISCLDEGIDIPSADKAILLANSTNPREYIQRIGRVIRQAPRKGNAQVFDFIVAPETARPLPDELRKFEKDVFQKELSRVTEMAMNAINNATVLAEIEQMR